MESSSTQNQKAMKTLYSLLTTVFITLISLCSISQPGSLDLQFGNDGTVMAPVTTTTEHGYAMAVQGDGKILVAGYRETGGNQDFAVARYNADGSLDNSFGSNGVALIDGGTSSDAAWSMTLQADGKILLGGSVYNQNSTVDDFALVRLNTDGTPDATFGTNGVVTTDIDLNWDNAYEILVLDDGKILLGGDGYITGRRCATIVRYNTDGSVDTDFGFLGVAHFCVGQEDARTRDIALQSDGKIVVAGYFSEGMDDHAFVARFNPEGTVDTFFGLNGYASLDIGGREDRLFSVVVLEDDKILAGGYTRDEGLMENDYLFVKYQSDGTLDTDFGSNGIMMFNFGANDQTRDMAILSDGKILSAGGAFSFELLRLNSDGSLDTGFGDNGKVNTSIGTYCHANRIMLYPGNKAVVAGQASSSGIYNFALARYLLQDDAGISDADNTSMKLNVYPNPAREKVTISYELRSAQEINIDLINLVGQRTTSFLSDNKQEPGMYSYEFRLPGNIPAGVYFIRLSTEKGQGIQKLILE